MDHTPGPWTVEASWTNSLGFVFTLEEQSDIESPQHDLIRKVNAHLIAAAPDLLEALCELLDDSVYADGEGHAPVGLADSAGKAHKAITKATRE